MKYEASEQIEDSFLKMAPKRSPVDKPENKSEATKLTRVIKPRKERKPKFTGPFEKLDGAMVGDIVVMFCMIELHTDRFGRSINFAKVVGATKSGHPRLCHVDHAETLPPDNERERRTAVTPGKVHEFYKSALSPNGYWKKKQYMFSERYDPDKKYHVEKSYGLW